MTQQERARLRELFAKWTSDYRAKKGQTAQQGVTPQPAKAG